MKISTLMMLWVPVVVVRVVVFSSTLLSLLVLLLVSSSRVSSLVKFLLSRSLKAPLQTHRMST